MKAKEKLTEKFGNGYHICVGLDTDVNKIPAYLRKGENPVLEFNKVIIDNTFDICAGYKLNLAFYENEGSRGFELLARTLEYIPSDSFTIGDAKRGDIGNTSKMYAAALYDHLNFDSATLNPYMGIDSIEPFLNYEERINFILSLTSNKSAADLEKSLLDDGKYLYQKVIQKVVEWNGRKNCGIVFGATNPEELKNNIDRFNDLFVLLPGIGAQGGSLEATVRIFSEAGKNKFIINSSRAVIYADSGKEFGRSARKAVEDYNDVIKKIIET